MVESLRGDTESSTQQTLPEASGRCARHGRPGSRTRGSSTRLLYVTGEPGGLTPATLHKGMPTAQGALRKHQPPWPRLGEGSGKASKWQRLWAELQGAYPSSSCEVTKPSSYWTPPPASLTSCLRASVASSIIFEGNDIIVRGVSTLHKSH